VPAGCWQSLLLPSHSSRLHGLPSSVHAVPAELLASAGQFGPLPGQFSAGSHSPAESRQTVLDDLKASAGQTVLDPVQVSSTSQAPAAARHTAPALPAGCWQVTFVPSHWSAVQGLPSEVQAVPLDALASAGQLGPLPEQNSAGSHSPPEARHCVLEDANPSAGQVVLVPVQVSPTSQTPADHRPPPLPLPAGCWQVTFVPSHRSSVHALPSEVHAVPLAFLASVGQLGPFPEQFSARSHSSAATRHTVLEERKPSAGQLPLDPLQVSCMSQLPAEGRHTVPAATKVQVVVQHDMLEPLAVPSSHCSPAVVSTLPSPQTDILPTSMNSHRHFDE